MTSTKATSTHAVAERQRILISARRLFAEKGIEVTTLHEIAANAAVDPSVVQQLFGGKAHLLVAALGVPFNPEQVVPRILEGPRNEAGQRVVSAFLYIWDDPANRHRLLPILRSAMTDDQAAMLVQQFLSAIILRRVADAYDVPLLRLTALAAQLVGLATLRYVIDLEPLASADAAEVVALVAPTVQRYIDDV